MAPSDGRRWPRSNHQRLTSDERCRPFWPTSHQPTVFGEGIIVLVLKNWYQPYPNPFKNRVTNSAEALLDKSSSQTAATKQGLANILNSEKATKEYCIPKTVDPSIVCKNEGAVSVSPNWNGHNCTPSKQLHAYPPEIAKFNTKAILLPTQGMHALSWARFHANHSKWPATFVSTWIPPIWINHDISII